MISIQNIKTIVFWSYIELICRYRRSLLGPFWEAFNAIILTLGISVIFSSVFGGDPGQNIAYIGIGVVFWGFLSALIVDGPTVFVDKSSVLLGRRFPLEFIILNKIFNLLIVLLHILPFCLIGLLLADVDLSFSTFLVLPNLALLCVFGYASLMVFGVLGAIYRDIQMILRNLVQVSLFVTPVFWNPDLISKDRLFVIDYNPLFHLLRLLRDPLLGNSIPLSSYVFVLVISVGLLFLGSVLRRRLSHKMALYI